MNPRSIIRQMTADGVALSLSATGNIKASGDQSAVDKWLPTIRERKPEIIEALQDAANDSVGGIPDDRRTCRQCGKLSASGICTAAYPGGPVSARRGYRPQPDTLQRCKGYQPNATDTDQRPASDRWPGL